jgi:hypothetical protein
MQPKWFNPACLILGPLLAIACSPAPTPATFDAGTGDNPLDGGTISNDGRNIVLDLDDGEGRLEGVTISGASDGSIIFDDPADGVIVPRSIETGADNVITISREDETVTVSLSLPVVERIEFMGQIPPELEVTRDLFLNEDRGPAGMVDTCPVIVDSVDDFCSRFAEKQIAARAEITGFLTDLASEAVGTPVGSDLIVGFVDSFFDVLQDFCDGWTELRDGTSESTPVDPCGE